MPTFVSVPHVEPEQPGELSLVPVELRSQLTPFLLESFWTVAVIESVPPTAIDATVGETETLIAEPGVVEIGLAMLVSEESAGVDPRCFIWADARCEARILTIASATKNLKSELMSVIRELLFSLSSH